MSSGRKGKTLRGLAAKYGATVRKRYSRILNVRKLKRQCPSCGSWQLKREAAGIWRCRACAYTVAGGAYDVATRQTG